ncbi:hypothetical protein [Amycolatopsis sp. cg9]|uniref:hypothetical protein n=1 Tax=Amycolatopsis sp. cg9 TaxID=3238801 RepID=UPI0035263419
MIPGVGSGMADAAPLLDLVDTQVTTFDGDLGDDFSVVGWADCVAPRDAGEARDPAYAAAGAGRRQWSLRRGVRLGSAARAAPTGEPDPAEGRKHRVWLAGAAPGTLGVSAVRHHPRGPL